MRAKSEKKFSSVPLQYVCHVVKGLLIISLLHEESFHQRNDAKKVEEHCILHSSIFSCQCGGGAK